MKELMFVKMRLVLAGGDEMGTPFHPTKDFSPQPPVALVSKLMKELMFVKMRLVLAGVNELVTPFHATKYFPANPAFALSHPMSMCWKEAYGNPLKLMKPDPVCRRKFTFVTPGPELAKNSRITTGDSTKKLLVRGACNQKLGPCPSLNSVGLKRSEEHTSE